MAHEKRQRSARENGAAEPRGLRESAAPETAMERVLLARHPQRPTARQYIAAMIDDFRELHGDRLCGDDRSILGGIGWFCGRAVTVIAQQKGRSLEENLEFNFGMPRPEGYRKAQRLARQAEKFGRPILTFIDTPGAYPGVEAEQRGQGEAIASCLALFAGLHVPVIAAVIGEGGSGGALALGVANTVLMLENAVYSVLSPEGFAAILWKDSSRAEEAAAMMKLTAPELLRLGVADRVVAEGPLGAHLAPAQAAEHLKNAIAQELDKLLPLTGRELAEQRYQRFRRLGQVSYQTEGIK